MSIPARQFYAQVAHTIRSTVTLATPGIGAGVPIGTLPSGARIMNIQCWIEVAFNAGTTNVLNLGTTATGAEIAASAQVIAGTLGLKAPTAGLTVYPLVDTTIYANYAQTGTAATVGTATFVITYMPDIDR